jgi:predicted alpha/beta-hydrolase family hydrolase
VTTNVSPLDAPPVLIAGTRDGEVGQRELAELIVLIHQRRLVQAASNLHDRGPVNLVDGFC